MQLTRSLLARCLALAVAGTFASIASAANSASCAGCHKDITESNHISAHKNVACSTCHSDLDKHVAGQVKRPGTNNDPAVCGTCHKEQFTSLYKANDKREARKSKTAANGPSPNPFFNMALGGHGFTTEHDEPRSHNFMLMDQMLVDRGWGGRFQPKEGWLYAAHGSGAIKAWDMVKDIWPGDNQQKVRGVPGTAAAGNAVCWTCKTTDPMLGWAYLGDPKPGTTFSRTGSPIDVMRASNHALNCNFCHDPHNAKPRIVRDALIQAVTRTDFPSVYNEGRNWAKVDVKDAGVRGFVRKVGYLSKPDSKLMCAQCHVEYVCNPGLDPKTGKKVGFDSRLTNLFPFVTTDTIEKFYDHVGYADFKHPLTGAKLIKMQHPDTETYNNSVHDKAGIGCAACHMPKVKKGGKTITTTGPPLPATT
ncbi:MAG: ammonia-forming cytochrome c nitrite reductase subunit c552 [Mesosutterella sp.]|nr:ammonia-forming cytochrome c nitrite reductase subunit c552 [Mesosutterella sp.]